MVESTTLLAPLAKLLRLNSASIASISAGKVVNLVSNDARRFDDYSPHVPWLILAPIELGMVRSHACRFHPAGHSIMITS